LKWICNPVLDKIVNITNKRNSYKHEHSQQRRFDQRYLLMMDWPMVLYKHEWIQYKNTGKFARVVGIISYMVLEFGRGLNLLPTAQG
jgi:hypothetical protein